MTLVFGGLWIWQRKRMGALFYITAAGVIYGFVATLAKVVITRIQFGDFDWLTFTCLAALIISRRRRRVLRADRVLVRARRISSSPDSRSSTRSSRSSSASSSSTRPPARRSGSTSPSRVVGAIAVWGVFQLARYHPQILSDSQELPIQRGSGRAADVAHPATGSIRVTEAVAKVWPDPPVKDKGDGSEPLIVSVVVGRPSMTMRPSSIRPLSPGVGAGAGIST